jgi:hypothetical protein
MVSGTRDQFFFLFEIVFRQLQVCYFVTPSLTRGRVCNLLYNRFWALPEQWLGGSKSNRTRGHILLSHLRLPQPGGSGPRIYIPQEQGGPVIPLGTGFPFCHLLWLTGLWWMYSNLPPHGVLTCFIYICIYSCFASRKRQQKGNTVSDETVKYGYWALITWLVSDCTVNYRPVFSSEKAPSKDE